MYRYIEEVVLQTIKDLPEEFRKKLKNVEFVVSDWPTGEDLQAINASPRSLLFGLYKGIPQTQRGIYYSHLPDKISIFAGPHIMASKDLPDLQSRLQKTVLHEIGHHFGLTDAELREIEMN
jgi:predicted Zn-dependent protease with MMP-like domain